MKGGFFMLLKFAIADYKEDREFNNSSEANMRNIHYNLNVFYEYCIENEITNIEEVTHQHVRNFLMMRKEEGDKPSTLNTRLLRIRALFNYCVEYEYIKKSPASRVKRQKENIRIEVFTDEQINQMLSYYRRLKQRDKSLYSYRDYTLIVFLLSTGFRKEETCNLKWSDVDLVNKTIKVFGKNKKLETIVITEKLAKELSAFYLFTKRYFNEETEYVFPNRYGKRLTRNAVHMIFRGLKEKMNFKDVRVSAHTFRHTFCNRLVASGMSPFAIQKMMRHENITVTMRYVNLWSEQLRKLNDEHNPLNNLSI